MSELNAIPLLVHASDRTAVDTVASLLRGQGLTTHCTWIPSLEDIGDALEQLNPELLVSVEPGLDVLADLATIRDQVAPSVPLVVLRELCSQESIGADMLRGARDTASPLFPERAVAVLRRELRAFRMERTLTTTLNVAQDYRKKLQTVLRSSKDAIAQVAEGIVVDVNDAWLELFGRDRADSFVGQPVMDFFDGDTQEALRGALSACARGRWSELPLKAGALFKDGGVAPLELVLSRAEHDGEPCVQLTAPARRRDDRQVARELEAAVHQDAGSGLWTRRHLLTLVQEQLRTPIPGGARFFVCMRLDRVSEIERQVGILHTDDLLAQFAALVRGHANPKDLVGHFGGVTLAALLDRGNLRDVEAWCDALVEKVARQSYMVGEASVQATCSVGIGQVLGSEPDINQCALQAQDCLRRARERGGNRVVVEARQDQDTRVLAYDQVWVRHIQAALAENRFRLVQQPVASLTGDGQKVHEVAVRMLDQQGKDVLPSEFLPAAARNNLLRDIDRWVLGAALASITRNRPDLLFVRLSSDSINDRELPDWLQARLASMRVDPARLCLQCTETDLANLQTRLQEQFRRLRALGVRLAIEHFGTRPDSISLLEGLDFDYLKIDGSLMQALGSNRQQQQLIRRITELAGRLQVATVAERVEDANTMAIVFQLGVQYIQGYLVNAPEEVVLSS